jgi:hypothetical protein
MAPRGFEWNEFKNWLRDNTAWRIPVDAESKHVDVEFGSGRKNLGAQHSSVVSAHNLKRNCRHTLPVGLSATYTTPALKCD